MRGNAVSGLIGDHNEEALRHVPAFREAMGDRVPHPFDQDFYAARVAHPYFGYVLAQNDGCEDFWMISHDDDLVAQHYLWYGRNAYEHLSVQAWVQRAKARSGHVLDVGAFSGLYAMLAYFSNKSNRVHLFEPTARAYARAIDNCRVNFVLGQIVCHRLALSDRPRLVEFNHFRGPSELGSGASYVRKDFETIYDVEVCSASTLDEVCTSLDLQPTLVKIDVEEAEADVLRGSERLIAARSAAFLIEVTAKTCEAVFDLMPGYECQLVDETGRRLIPIDGNRERMLELVNSIGFGNILFDPPLGG
jgi:FkbM family methyltransferase